LPPPALLLVHGGGGNGLGMIDVWKAFAEAHQILLVAPTLPLGAAIEVLEPQLFPLLMDSVQSSWKHDPARRYVFGYSAGGFVTYDAAMFTSSYFAAVGVFAGIITPDYDWILQKATRKTPVAIYIGDRDQFFSVSQAEATRDVLLANGFPVHFTLMTNQDHDYAAVAEFVNDDVWAFFGQHPLP
jgi:predicted esterase